MNIGPTLVLVAIIALGASGLILMMLAVANPTIDDGVSKSRAPSTQHVPLRVITRRDGVAPARRHARPAMHLRLVVTREQEPPRRSAYPRTRRWGILASPDARFVTGSVACTLAVSLALGLLLTHLSV